MYHNISQLAWKCCDRTMKFVTSVFCCVMVHSLVWNSPVALLPVDRIAGFPDTGRVIQPQGILFADVEGHREKVVGRPYFGYPFKHLQAVFLTDDTGSIQRLVTADVLDDCRFLFLDQVPPGERSRRDSWQWSMWMR